MIRKYSFYEGRGDIHKIISLHGGEGLIECFHALQSKDRLSWWSPSPHRPRNRAEADLPGRSGSQRLSRPSGISSSGKRGHGFKYNLTLNARRNSIGAYAEASETRCSRNVVSGSSKRDILNSGKIRILYSYGRPSFPRWAGQGSQKETSHGNKDQDHHCKRFS